MIEYHASIFFCPKKSCQKLWSHTRLVVMYTILRPASNVAPQTRRTILQIQVDPIRLSGQTSNLSRRNEFWTATKCWDRGWNINMFKLPSCIHFYSWKDQRLTSRRSSDVLPICRRKDRLGRSKYNKTNLIVSNFDLIIWLNSHNLVPLVWRQYDVWPGLQH